MYSANNTENIAKNVTYDFFCLAEEKITKITAKKRKNL